MKVNSIDIKWPELFKPIVGLKTNVSNRITIEREVIPIIFVPGIMGSRLQNSTGKKVWDPDDNSFMLRNYGKYNVTAGKRKALLIGDQFEPKYLQASNNDSEHNKKFTNEKDSNRAERGWGSVFWSSYGNLLTALQNHEWDEPLRHCFEFPVHAFGYNWTDTNFNAGKELSKTIDEIIKSYKTNGRESKGVILVSHSMGGLVCRSACNLHGAEKQVLGVLHGVQPTTGAAAAYWRMKARFERPHGSPNWVLWDWLRNPTKMLKHRVFGKITSWTLGTDGEEVTSLLGNAPGGLELLPNQHYSNNNNRSQWLHIPNREGVVNSLPRSGNPYEETYRNKEDVFWRMVNPAYLDPQKNSFVNSDANLKKMENSWESYLNNLELAEYFHDMLKNDRHKNTYQFYSSGYETVDEIVFTRNQYAPSFGADMRKAIGIRTSSATRGKYLVNLN
jgi:pimeloyl-ACP methyl ester carboxylesterase